MPAKAVNHDRSTRINANVCSIDNTHLGHDQKRIIFSFWDASSHLMLLTELRPRDYPSVLLAHRLNRLSRLSSQIKPLRLSALRPPMALLIAMQFWPPPVLDP